MSNAPRMWWRKWWTPNRIVVAVVVALAEAAPLPPGHSAEAAFLNPVSSAG